jgi:hypothetical protein
MPRAALQEESHNLRDGDGGPARARREQQRPARARRGRMADLSQ